MLGATGASGGQKYERVCEAEAIRKARGGEAGRVAGLRRACLAKRRCLLLCHVRHAKKPLSRQPEPLYR